MWHMEGEYVFVACIVATLVYSVFISMGDEVIKIRLGEKRLAGVDQESWGRMD